MPFFGGSDFNHQVSKTYEHNKSIEYLNRWLKSSFSKDCYNGGASGIFLSGCGRPEQSIYKNNFHYTSLFPHYERL